MDIFCVEKKSRSRSNGSSEPTLFQTFLEKGANNWNPASQWDTNWRSITTNAKISSIILSVKLEDLKVLRRSPDLLNNVKIGQGQLQLIMEQILFYHIWGLQPFWSSDLNNLMNNPSNSPVISMRKMFR